MRGKNVLDLFPLKILYNYYICRSGPQTFGGRGPDPGSASLDLYATANYLEMFIHNLHLSF